MSWIDAVHTTPWETMLRLYEGSWWGSFCGMGGRLPSAQQPLQTPGASASVTPLGSPRASRHGTSTSPFSLDDQDPGSAPYGSPLAELRGSAAGQTSLLDRPSFTFNKTLPGTSPESFHISSPNSAANRIQDASRYLTDTSSLLQSAASVHPHVTSLAQYQPTPFPFSYATPQAGTSPSSLPLNIHPSSSHPLHGTSRLHAPAYQAAALAPLADIAAGAIPAPCPPNSRLQGMDSLEQAFLASEDTPPPEQLLGSLVNVPPPTSSMRMAAAASSYPSGGRHVQPPAALHHSQPYLNHYQAQLQYQQQLQAQQLQPLPQYPPPQQPQQPLQTQGLRQVQYPQQYPQAGGMPAQQHQQHQQHQHQPGGPVEQPSATGLLGGGTRVVGPAGPRRPDDFAAFQAMRVHKVKLPPLPGGAAGPGGGPQEPVEHKVRQGLPLEAPMPAAAATAGAEGREGRPGAAGDTHPAGPEAAGGQMPCTSQVSANSHLEAVSGQPPSSGQQQQQQQQGGTRAGHSGHASAALSQRGVHRVPSAPATTGLAPASTPPTAPPAQPWVGRLLPPVQGCDAASGLYRLLLAQVVESGVEAGDGRARQARLVLRLSPLRVDVAGMVLELEAEAAFAALTHGYDTSNCSVMVVGTGVAEPGPPGHIFLTCLSAAPAGASADADAFSPSAALPPAAQPATPALQGQGDAAGARDPANPAHSKPTLDVAKVMEQLLCTALPPGTTVHHVYPSDSPRHPR